MRLMNKNMNKKYRQYIGILAALGSYYFIHEGAHWLYAITHGVFKTIHLMAMGVQIDVHRELMTDAQLGIFCLVGPLATFLAGMIMVMLGNKICALRSSVIKSCCWYISIIFLILDPLYLSILYRFVGGGDMNGIKLILPEMGVATVGIILLAVNLFLLYKVLLPKYKKAFLGVNN